MPGFEVRSRSTTAQLIILLALTLAVGCATIESPPGGPIDETPPVLVSVWPDSGAVNLPDTKVIILTFSEKMTPQLADRFMYLYPTIPIEKTKWHRRREVEIVLTEPLPPDTVIVVEIPVGMKDNHGVAGVHGYRYPVATAGAVPEGELTGQLLYEEGPLIGGVVELYDVPPDTLEYFQQRILRRTETDSLGHFHFRWLPVPGGPWLVRAFVDGNSDLRPGDNEATRLLPGDFSLIDSIPRRVLAMTTLYSPNTPGQLVGHLDSVVVWPGAVLAWSMAITAEDTGWTATPQKYPLHAKRVVPRGENFILPSVSAGLNRLIFFVDANGDSMLSALPAGADTPDSVAWFLEPFAVVDSLNVEPGLDSSFPSPRFPATLTPWHGGDRPKDEQTTG